MTITQTSTKLKSNKKISFSLTNDPDFGEEWSHPKFSFIASTLSELPDIYDWSKSFIIALIEIWYGRRGISQISGNCHKLVARRIIYYRSKFNGNLKVRRIYVSQPIEGVSEITVTLKNEERVRSLILRFEGVDRRWICTELFII